MLRIDTELRRRGFEYHDNQIRTIHDRNYSLAIQEGTRLQQRETVENAIATFETAAIQISTGRARIASQNLQNLYLRTFRSLGNQASLQTEIFNGSSIYAMALLRNSTDREVRRWMQMLSNGYIP